MTSAPISYPTAPGRGRDVAHLLKLDVQYLSIWDWYCFVLAFACCVSFKVGGTLFGSDFLLLLGLPVLLTTRFHVLFYKPVERVLLLGGLWLLSQVATDFIRSTTPEDYARGWLKILFTLGHFCAAWILIHNSKTRCMLYAFGLALGTALRSGSFTNDFVKTDPWKFGYSFPASIVVLLSVCFLMRRRYSAYYLLPVAVLALLNIVEGFRSQGLILLLTAVLTHGYKSLRQSGKTLSKIKLAGLALAVLLAGVGLDLLYSYAASQNLLGQESYKKYQKQAIGAGGVLLGGRSEMFASTAAIADSPWIGHGSWAKDPKYMWILVKRLREFGYYGASLDPDTQAAAQNGTIPSHSHLLGAWVEAGICGAVFWAYVLYLLLRFLFTLSGDEPFLPFAIFAVALLSWDIMFSPYGAERRFSVTFFLAFVLTISYQRERARARVQQLDYDHAYEPAPAG